MQQRVRLSTQRLAPLCVLWAVLLAGCQERAGQAQQMAPGHLFRPTRKPVVSSPLAYDWNSDGNLEIAVGSWDGYFYVMDRNLQDLDGWPKWSLRGYFSSPALSDLDGWAHTLVALGACWMQRLFLATN